MQSFSSIQYIGKDTLFLRHLFGFSKADLLGDLAPHIGHNFTARHPLKMNIPSNFLTAPILFPAVVQTKVTGVHSLLIEKALARLVYPSSPYDVELRKKCSAL